MTSKLLRNPGFDIPFVIPAFNLKACSKIVVIFANYELLLLEGVCIFGAFMPMFILKVGTSINER